ncbi:hypothetical protein [Brevibacillus massiliensis]|uniref:hypothetical protein n=1 Tax=Brevibacillus massiliensis TaxID=1118054 RepID=UPI0003706EB0|nr:hypothetical protein [Brevibacillus massiliensis]
MKLQKRLPTLPKKTKRQSSVQSWMPIKDIDQFHMVHQDQFCIAGIRVIPVNIDLMNPRERKGMISILYEVLNGLSGHFQFFCEGRPVDLDGYIAELETMKANTPDPIRKKILQSQIREAAQTAISGEALETLFFILFANKNKTELIEQVKQIAVDLKQRGITGYICDHKELMDMQFVFTHPIQAAYERMPEDTKDYIPPQLMNPERMRKHG